MAKVIRPNGGNSVGRQYLKKMCWLVLCLAAGIGSAILCARASQWAASAFCLGAAGIGVHFLWRSAAILKVGAQGESETLRLLKKRLPGSYTVLPDLTLDHRGHKSQLDYAVVCPGRVYVVECKNVSGQISGSSRGSNLNQTKYRGGQIIEKKTMYNPVLQVEGHARTLRGILEDQKLHAQVTPVVYFANPRAQRRMDFAGRPVFFQQEGGADSLIRYLTSGPPARGGSTSEELIKGIILKNVSKG